MSHFKYSLLSLCFLTLICSAVEEEPTGKEEMEVTYQVCDEPAICYEDENEVQFQTCDAPAICYEEGYEPQDEVYNNEESRDMYYQLRGGGYITTGISAAVGFIVGCFLEREKDLTIDLLKEDREAGAAALRRKPECFKDLKDRVYGIYDAWLFDGAMVALIKCTRNKGNSSKEAAKVEIMVEAIERHHQTIREMAVMQITEMILKKLPTQPTSSSSSSSSSSSLQFVTRPPVRHHTIGREVIYRSNSNSTTYKESNDSLCIIS